MLGQSPCSIHLYAKSCPAAVWQLHKAVKQKDTELLYFLNDVLWPFSLVFNSQWPRLSKGSWYGNSILFSKVTCHQPGNKLPLEMRDLIFRCHGMMRGAVNAAPVHTALGENWSPQSTPVRKPFLQTSLWLKSSCTRVSMILGYKIFFGMLFRVWVIWSAQCS